MNVPPALLVKTTVSVVPVVTVALNVMPLIAALRTMFPAALSVIVLVGPPLANFSFSNEVFKSCAFSTVIVKFDKVLLSRSAMFVPPALKFRGVPVLNGIWLLIPGVPVFKSIVGESFVAASVTVKVATTLSSSLSLAVTLNTRVPDRVSEVLLYFSASINIS